MQIVRYDIDKNILTVGFKENNFVVFSSIFYDITKTKHELLQQAYMQCKKTIEYEKTQTEHSIITDKVGEEFNPESSKPIKLEIDFDNLKGQVIDQYEDAVSIDIKFSIESTDKARIKDNSIVEEEVTKDTEYYIVATYKDLEKREKRIIYAPIEPQIANDVIGEEEIAISEAVIDLDNRLQKLEGGN